MVDHVVGGNIVLLCRTCCFGHSETFHLIFKNEATNTDLCIYEPLERHRNAGSGVFQNSDVLNDNNWNTFRIQIEHHKLCSANPARLLPKRKYWTKKFLVLGTQLPNVEWIMRVESTSRQQWFDWSTKPTRLVPHEHVNVFAADRQLASFSLEHFKWALPAPGKNSP